MKRFFIKINLIIILVLLFNSCAKRGGISGGPIDSIPPVLLEAIPPNYSTHFETNKIVLKFDEYIKLKNSNTQLIISPPMEIQPELSPTGLADKKVTIQLFDTLKPNTTYTFNFGESIVDNNEGNQFPNFKYVFSTGAVIDSLKLNVKITDVFSRTLPKNMKVLLYDAENFSDSTIFRKKPLYVGLLPDKKDQLTIENIREGKYYIFALEDNNQNYTFENSTEKIGFKYQPITIPNDTLQNLYIFKDEKTIAYNKPRRIDQFKWAIPFFDYPENYNDINITVSDYKNIIPTRFFKDKTKDTLYVFTQNVNADSLQFAIKSKTLEEKYNTIVTNNTKKDSLKIKLNTSNSLLLTDTINYGVTTPISIINKDKILLEKIWKDEKSTETQSKAIDFNTVFDSLYNEIKIVYPLEPESEYKVTITPGAIIDFYEKTNDSTHSTFRTNAITDYCSITLNWQPSQESPLIFQLTDSNEKLVYQKIANAGDTSLKFQLVKPTNYFLRVIYDENKNKRWDSGNYLEHKQPEKVYHLNKTIDARANWELNENLDLSIFSKNDTLHNKDTTL